MRPEINMDAPIAKYMNLNHFLNMLVHGKFYACRRFKFEDRKESILHTWEIGELHEFHSKPSKDVKDMEYMTAQKIIDEYKQYSYLPTSCWTLNANENYLMWKAYTHECGVMITSSINRFVDAIDYSEYDLICIPMMYKGYRNESYLDAKDRFYSDERELRFYFDYDNDDMTTLDGDHIELPVEPSKLISEVVISPFMPRVVSSLLIKHLKDNYNLNARLSAIG